MDYPVRREQDAWVVSLTGEVDLHHSPRAREVLLEAVGRGRKVLVDLSGVEYLDSSGVASLVEAFQLAKRNDVPFALVAVQDAALRVLQLARLDRVFVLHDSVADGL